MKTLIKYLVQGLLLTVPLVITVYVLYRLFFWITGLLMKVGLNIHPVLDPLIVLAVIATVLILLGWLASSILFQSLFDFMERILEHLPVIKHIYSPVKDFMGAFVGNKKKFTKPVLVLTNPMAGIEEMGFITHEDMNDFNIKEKVAVYMPHSYAFSGKLLIVPRENIRPINDVSGGDAMKFIVSGGVTDVDDD